MDPESIVKMELLTSEFWPAETKKATHYGWLLGANAGVTWRANCVIPYGEPNDLSSAVDEAEQFYNKARIHSAFKLTSATQVARELDVLLERRGYEKQMITYVQVRSLNDVGEPTSLARVTLDDGLSDEWLQKQAVDQRYQGEKLQILSGIIKRIPGQKAFALVREDEGAVAVGLGVVHKGWLALFSIRTDPHMRRRGLGGAVSDALLHWGTQRGAKDAFLQVEADNEPALRLYAERGFRTAYTYWYRIRTLQRRESAS